MLRHRLQDLEIGDQLSFGNWVTPFLLKRRGLRLNLEHDRCRHDILDRDIEFLCLFLQR